MAAAAARSVWLRDTTGPGGETLCGRNDVLTAERFWRDYIDRGKMWKYARSVIGTRAGAASSPLAKTWRRRTTTAVPGTTPPRWRCRWRRCTRVAVKTNSKTTRTKRRATTLRRGNASGAKAFRHVYLLFRVYTIYYSVLHAASCITYKQATALLKLSELAVLLHRSITLCDKKKKMLETEENWK